MKRNLLLSFLLLFVTVLSVSCMSEEQAGSRPLRVMLTETEGLTVLSENPMLVEPGQNAEFTVELSEEYKIISLSDNAQYEDGMIRLENVHYPNTITAETAEKKKYLFEYLWNKNRGNLEVSVNSGVYYEDTEITLHAEPRRGLYFLGYSTGGYLANGGELIYASPDYTFKLSETVELYCNFQNTPGQYLFYHGNGGTVTKSGEESLRTMFSNDFYLFPNTLPLQGIFEREGYALIGYNTEADGSGEFYGAGWKVEAEKLETELWLQWVKETPAEHFIYEIKGETALITGYTGEDTMLVIPETIEGKNVTEIKKGAFNGCSFDTIVFPRHMKKIQNNAFTDCSELDTLYLPDSITTMTERSFSGSVIRKIVVNAVQDPSFSYALMSTGSVKFERLMSIDEPKVILISGSSSLYGMNSELFEDEMTGAYRMVNYGCHAHTPSPFFMELAAAFVNEGDLVVTAPEPLYQQWGDNVFNTTLWQIFEAAYNAFSYVDVSHYAKVLSSFADFNRMRSPLRKLDYTYHLDYYSAFGDYMLPRPNANPNHVTFNNGVLDFSFSFLSEERVASYNLSADLITANGGKVLMSFSPTNKNGLSEISKTSAHRDRFVEEVKAKYHAEVISDLDNYLWTGTYFYDTDLHMSTEGAELRTKQLAKDIRTYLYE